MNEHRNESEPLAPFFPCCFNPFMPQVRMGSSGATRLRSSAHRARAGSSPGGSRARRRALLCERDTGGGLHAEGRGRRGAGPDGGGACRGSRGRRQRCAQSRCLFPVRAADPPPRDPAAPPAAPGPLPARFPVPAQRTPPPPQPCPSSRGPAGRRSWSAR